MIAALDRLVAFCLAAAVSAGCTDPAAPGPVVLTTWSFETGMDGWLAEGLDLDDPPVAWGIHRSDDRATDGRWSVRYDLANYNDAGKIWLRREIAVAPGAYEVTIRFGFATRDFGLPNLWTVIAGAAPSAPTRAADLPYGGHTGTGEDTDLGWVWLAKEYTDSLEVGPDGVLHVMVGVRGTWETPRSYYVDGLEVRITPIAGSANE